MKRLLRHSLAALAAALLAACAAPPQKPATTPGGAYAGTAAHADDVAASGKLPAYRRVAPLQGALTLSGSSAVSTFARAWGAAFQRIYPNAAVNVVAKSSSSAIGDMAANPAIIGMTSRALNAAERERFAKQHGAPPLELRVAIDAVAIYVFKDNPLKSLTLAQLGRIYAATPKNGAPIERWGQIGLDGAWAEREIGLAGFDAGRGAYEIMRDLVLRGGDFHSNKSIEPVSTSVVQAVGVDPGAIGYASVYFRTARTRVLPIQTASGELAGPTEADSASGTYPLARYLYLHLGTPKGGVENMAREFLRFVLSEEGQNVARASGAFAIAPALAHQQRGALAQ
ncbi:MAG: phosphate-binding protein [Betaproteobacteria bacterium]|nr:phosphate-binding protein [Betaproteobacteria bacterium]